MPALLAMIMMCSSCRSSSSSDCSSAEALPQWVRSTNSATRCCTLADGRNATTAYGVVPAAMNSIISSQDLVELILLLFSRLPIGDPRPRLFKHTAKSGYGLIPRTLVRS
jgi:hypothetical protein